MGCLEVPVYIGVAVYPTYQLGVHAVLPSSSCRPPCNHHSQPPHTPARASPSRTTPSTHHLIPWHTHPHAPSLPPAQTPAGDEKPRGNGEALETKPLHIIVAASISVVRRHATQIPLHLLLGQVALAQSFSLSLPPLSCLVSINGPAPAAAAPTPALPACACCCRVFLAALALPASSSSSSSSFSSQPPPPPQACGVGMCLCPCAYT